MALSPNNRGGPLGAGTSKPVRVGPAKVVRRGPVSQSLAQVANQRVNQQLNPQIAAQNTFNARQSSVIQQFANALLGKLQPVAGQVGADYDKAIGQIGSLSGQAAQYFSGQNPAASQQQLLSSVGAPPEQQAQSAAGLGDTFRGGAGVLAYTGGTIPGSALATDKAAAQSQAAQLPGIAALKGQQDLASALWQQGQDRQKLLATRPALLQEAEQNIRTNQSARAKAVLGQQNLTEKQREFGITAGQKQAAADFLQWYRTQGVNQTEEKINQKASQFGVTATQRQQTIGIAGQRAATGAASAAETARHHAVTETQGAARIRIAKEKAKTAAASKVGVNKEYPNLTKSQVLHLRSGVAAAFNGVAEQTDATGKVTQKGLPPVSYQEAIDHAVSAGYSRAGATKMANHFYMPGQRGRPFPSTTKPKPDTGFRSADLTPP